LELLTSLVLSEFISGVNTLTATSLADTTIAAQPNITLLDFNKFKYNNSNQQYVTTKCCRLLWRDMVSNGAPRQVGVKGSTGSSYSNA
jgi:hypothetical protein